MFFGLEVKSQQNQAKPITLETSLKLSQAVLEPTKNGKKEPVSVMVEYEKKQFILCVLDSITNWQSPLDLIFSEGSQVKFFLKGNGTVHLTGYHHIEDVEDLSVSMSDPEMSDLNDEEEEDDDDEDEPQPKRLATAADKKSPKVNGKPNTIPVKLKDEKKKQQRKAAERASKMDNSKDADSDDESDDEDFNAIAAAYADADDDDDDDEEMSDEDMDEDDVSDEEGDLDDEEDSDEE